MDSIVKAIASAAVEFWEALERQAEPVFVGEVDDELGLIGLVALDGRDTGIDTASHEHPTGLKERFISEVLSTAGPIHKALKAQFQMTANMVAFITEIHTTQGDDETKVSVEVHGLGASLAGPGSEMSTTFGTNGNVEGTAKSPTVH